jgi:hypothetical protein
MFYIIQENTFKEYNYNNLINTLDRVGLDHVVVRSFPFTDKIISLSDIPDGPYDPTELPEVSVPDGQKVFCFGSVKLARTAKDKTWTPGSLQSPEHDMSVYGPVYGHHMLNSYPVTCGFADPIDWGFHVELFIRPSGDNKHFTGRKFDRKTWEEFVTHKLNSGHENSILPNTPIIISPVKTIYKEIRFWVVGGKVVTGSIYKSGTQVVYDRNVDPESLEFAQKMVDTYQVAEAFVIDVCLTQEGWKVVECNCINSAGFYDGDLQKLLMSLEDHYK